MFSSLLSLTLAALALQVSASPLVERANKVTCKSDKLYYGPLYLTPRAGQGEDLPDLPVSLLNGRFKVNDYTGNKASVLSTRDDNGNPVTPDIFEFADCDSKYMGYEQGIPHTVSYGVLRPKGTSKHCITASAGTLTGAAPKQAFTNSVCPTNDDLTQLWSYFEFSGGNDIAILLGHTAAQGDGVDNHVLTVSKAGHGQVQLYSKGEAPEGAIDYLFKIKRSAV